MGNALTITLLLLHALLAVALLGAITHQALAGTRSEGERRSFVRRYRNVDGSLYSRIVVLLFVSSVLLGACLYPSYRLLVRPALEAANLRAANGIFEIKEHLAALGLLLLPAYWVLWQPTTGVEYRLPKRVLTWILAAIVWWSFLAGHVLNDIHGMFK